MSDKGELVDFAEGFAVLLADAGVGLTWQDDGVYAANEHGIYIMIVPPTPDRICSLTPYVLRHDSVQNMSTVGLNVRLRSADQDPRPLLTLSSDIADVMLGNWPLTLSTGVRVSLLEFTSATSLDQDDRQRWNWSSNFAAETYWPTTHRH